MVIAQNDREFVTTCSHREDSCLISSSAFHPVEIQTTNTQQGRQKPNAKMTTNRCLKHKDTSGVSELLTCCSCNTMLLDSASDLSNSVLKSNALDSKIPPVSTQSRGNWNSIAKCGRSCLNVNGVVSSQSDFTLHELSPVTKFIPPSELSRVTKFATKTEHSPVAICVTQSTSSLVDICAAQSTNSPVSIFATPVRLFSGMHSPNFRLPFDVQSNDFSPVSICSVSSPQSSSSSSSSSPVLGVRPGVRVCMFPSSVGGGGSSGSAGFRTMLGSPDATLTTLSSDVQITNSTSSQDRFHQFTTGDHPRVDTNGFYIDYPLDSGLPPVTQYPELSRHRESKKYEIWRRLLGENAEQNWRSVCENQSRVLKQQIRKGIPRDWRYRVWPLLTGGQFLLERNPGQYHQLLRQPCLVEGGITEDLHRTLPNHVLFSEPGGEGQKALFRVLKAYSIFDTAVGYAPGTASIVAILLIVMEEECAFWTFVALMSDEVNGPRAKTAGPLVQCRNLFLEGIPLTLKVISQLKHLLNDKLPAVARKFEDGEIETSQYGAKWCMTLFCFILPFQHLVRVWDVFFLEGWKIAFRTCLAIIRLIESDILKQPNAAVGEVLDVRAIAQRIPAPDLFIKMMLGVKISKSLESWRPNNEDNAS